MVFPRKFFHAMLVATLLAMIGARPSAGDTVENPRRPFLLEIPELGGPPTNDLKLRVPTTTVGRLRFRIIQPFAREIDYGKIFTRINGNSAGIIQRVLADAKGTIIDCDLTSREIFHLRKGVNAVEITAIDRQQKTYYASFLISVVQGDPSFGAVVEQPSVETFSTGTGQRGTPPKVTLVEPKLPLTASAGRKPIPVSGFVACFDGSTPVVKVNGGPVQVVETKTGGGRQLVEDEPDGRSFQFRFSAPPNTGSISVEAVDRSGVGTRVTIPLHPRPRTVPNTFTGKKYALLVGVSSYRYPSEGVKNLKFADADAIAMRDFLMTPEGGGFSGQNMVVLTNQAATVAAVRNALADLLAKAMPGDLVCFFLAGHGGPDPTNPLNLYFVLHDTRLAALAESGFSMSEMESILKKNARTDRLVVFIDSCHSGGISEKGFDGRKENNLVNFFSGKLFSGSGRAIMTSSDVNETSYENVRWGGGHGVFTWLVLEGLKGKADADHDSVVTVGELFSFVRVNVANETGFAQNPRIIPGSNENLPLAVLKGGRR